MEKQVTLYDNHDNWKVILIDEKKVVLYNKCDGVVDVVKKSSKYDRHVKCPVCHRDMPSPPPSPVNPNPMEDNLNSMGGNANIPPNANATLSPNYFQLLWSSTSEEGYSPNVGPGLNVGYYHRFFQEVSKIGSGGFGSVYLCRHVINGIDLGEYAIKKVPMGSNVAWQQRVFAEVQNLQRLQQHPNIIGYKHSWMEEDQPAHFGPPVPCLFILMEYANGGNLEDYIVEHFLSDQEIWRIFIDLCQGLGYLHHCGILHRDIKCNNILLSNTFDIATGAQAMRVLISDFGTSADILGTPPAKRTGNTGTVEYLAPELLSTNPLGEYQPYTEKCDMWALGVLLYKLCFAKFPYPSANLQEREISQVLREIATSDGITIPHHERDPRLSDLMVQLLDKNPNYRPSVAEILQRPYVQTKIYTPPIHASSHPHTAPATPTPTAPSTSISSSLRLRRSLTPTYPLLMDAKQSTSPKPPRPSSATTPALLPAPPQALVNKILSSFSPSLAIFLSSLSKKAACYVLICMAQLWLCFAIFAPLPPPIWLILLLVGCPMVGLMLNREQEKQFRTRLIIALIAVLVGASWVTYGWSRTTLHCTALSLLCFSYLYILSLG